MVFSRHKEEIALFMKKAKLEIIKQEINFLRERDRDRAQDVADAMSFSDLKTRWSARSSLSDRTLAQFKQKVNTEIDSRNVDSLNIKLGLLGGILFLSFLFGGWLWQRNR